MSGADIAFDRRCTSHMSDGMTRYVRRLHLLLPRVAPDLRFRFVGSGDNFDLREQLELPLALAAVQPRLVHVPTPFVPLLLRGRYVLTIHDLIDLHFPAFGKRKVGPYYRFAVAPVARRAQAVLTDDRATIADLRRFLGVDPGRVRVIPLGSDLTPPRSPRAALTGRPYFLYVGNRRPHKDLATLVRAWSLLDDELSADLVLTGAPDPDAPLEPPVRPGGNLVYAGRRSDDELAELYAGARAYVHPALREGFGLPLLEAMRMGTPVIAARSALPDVLVPHASAFTAGDVDALHALLSDALREPERWRARGAAAQAATVMLTWEHTARATADVYREFLA